MSRPPDARRSERERRVIHAGVSPVLPHVRPTTGHRIRAAVGTLCGALSLVGGLTWLLLNVAGPHRVVDVTVGVVYGVGGLVLLMPHRARLPGRITVAAATAAALAGTLAGLAAGATQMCCTYVYAMARGFPFHWIQRGAIADDPATARRLALGADWHADGIALAADLLFWAYAGVVTVMIARPRHRSVRNRAGQRV
jgi:hypothetical protein